MNLRDLRYLVALAEHRHFGRAAAASFVSQPTLSTQIKKLEDELGVALVERTPRKVLLTEVGREIAQRARDVLNEVDQIRAIARRTLDPESGTVRLGRTRRPISSSSWNRSEVEPDCGTSNTRHRVSKTRTSPERYSARRAGPALWRDGMRPSTNLPSSLTGW